MCKKNLQWIKWFTYMWIMCNIHVQLNAQSSLLKAHYPFNQCSTNDVTGTNKDSSTVIFGNPNCVCGITGMGYQFNTVNDKMIFSDVISSDEFGNTDFSLSFYFRPENANGVQDILSKRQYCDQVKGFSIKYNSQSQSLLVFMTEDSTNQINITQRIDLTQCWQHVVLVRENNRVYLYINGVNTANVVSNAKIRMKNSSSFFAISNSPCQGVTDVPFHGSIDDIRYYNNAIDAGTIRSIYLQQDKILNKDTTVFLGKSVDIRYNEVCAQKYKWTPSIGVSDVTIAEPSITPPVTTTYTVAAYYNGCTAMDTLLIKVVDPDILKCNTAPVPNAFTPNQDNLNDTYGLSNPGILEKLESFEIYDRWGGRMYVTDNPYENWDGTLNGSPVMAGVYYYRIRYLCKGESFVKEGSLTLIR